MDHPARGPMLAGGLGLLLHDAKCGINLYFPQQESRESTNRIEFLHLWGIDKLIFWSHYVLKQLIGRLLLCSVCHIMVNCLRNADCWKVSPLSGTWCDLCFVNTGASHMEPRKLGKPIDYSSGMCMGNLNSQIALHVESAKQLFITIFIPVVEHTPTLRHSMFLFLFSLFIYHSCQTDFLQFAYYGLQWMKWLQWQQF